MSASRATRHQYSPEADKHDYKQEARTITLINPWRATTGQHEIPKGREFVSLCATMSEDGKSLVKGTEFDQLVASGLIQPDQYHGVERVWSVYAKNLRAVEKVYPESQSRPTIIKGDIADYIDNHPELHPALVHLDFVDGPRATLPKVLRVLSRLSDKPGPTIVVWNVPTFSRFHDKVDGFRLEAWLDSIPGHPYYHQTLARGGWDPTWGYTYAGVSGHSPLQTTIFRRLA